MRRVADQEDRMSKNSKKNSRFLAVSLVPALALLALAAAGAARAADLSVAPIYKAPPVVTPQAYNWSGFYLGLNGGGGWGTSNWDSAGSFNLSGGVVGGTAGVNWQGGLAAGDIKAATPGFAGATQTNAGWTAGGGVELALTSNWTAKAEYLHVDLGNMNCGFNCGVAANNNVSVKSDLVRGGVNFRFGGAN
jgi:outer membrane immunogenic protein